MTLHGVWCSVLSVMARHTTEQHRPTRKPEAHACRCGKNGDGEHPCQNHGDITIKIQRRTYTILLRLLDYEAERMMRSVVSDGECADCLDEFKKRIAKTEILHRAVRAYATSKGVSIT